MPHPPSSSEFEAACSFLDGYLASRTFLVGHSLSVADIVVWSNIAGTGQRWESLRRSTKYQNLTLWFNCIAVDYAERNWEITCTKPERKIHDPTENTPGPEIDLPGAKIGEVCLRFAPEPSGYLHIGHAKAGLLNEYFADRYKGRLIVRIDDTNPSKESNEFVENVLRDIDTMGIKYDTVTYTSDYFPKLMEMAESLIMQGKAYVDDTPRTQMEVERRAGVESTCRNNTVEENLSLWREMVNGTESGMQCCLRGKLDIQDPNKSLHDPVYYRCNTDPHHRVGSTYKAYPTYDFACPFVDALQGVTHALRSSEYHDRNAQYYSILQDMGLQRVEIFEFSRLNMVYTLLSKRKFLWFVQNKKVDGWTDPRFPTIQGMVRRGLKIEALTQFILEQLEEKDDFVNHLNPCTTSALGDPDMRNLKKGEIIQLERKGYYRCDVPFTGPSKPIVLFAIPDGR
ncbi:unnamed protein product [Miscanthus lutarioriparius]|uniref:Glutamyl-tRNA synthetase n=1 Tax=Miscanthus lutarioriparius TaxID=422564 RepID=A0A811NW32_9POAL|nr:unnamed protein product [Miscanthus lutarioriparius]